MDTAQLHTLIEQLHSDDATERRGAAERLGEGDERAIYPLIKTLRDGSPGVQDAAMSSLISIGGEVTAYMVIPLLREDALIRNTAMIILKEIGNIELLSGLLKDKDDDIRKFATDLFIDIGNPEACRHIRRVLKDPNANVRASAVKAIGILGCPDLVPELIRAMSDEEWVCFSAIEAAARIGDPILVEALFGLLSSASDAVRFSALEALGRISTPEAGRILKEFFGMAKGIEKDEALKSLINIGLTPDMADLSDSLIKMLESDDRKEMITALKGLAMVRSHEAVPLIIDKAGTLDPSVPDELEILNVFRETLLEIRGINELIELLKSSDIRYKGKALALETLGRLKAVDAVSAIIELIRSPIRDIRRAGVKALGEIGNEDAVAPLMSSTEDPDGHVRKAAAIALGMLREPSSYETLFRLLDKEPYSDVKEEMVRALLSINEGKFVAGLDGYDESVREMIARFSENTDVLIPLSRDPSPRVRASAVLSLGKTSDEEASIRIKETSRDPDPEVRKAAAQSFEGLRCCRPELEALLRDNDMWVRFYAVKALAADTNENSVALMASMLVDPEMPVAMSAIDALAQCTLPEAMRVLEDLREHENPVIREKVREILANLW